MGSQGPLLTKGQYEWLQDNPEADTSNSSARTKRSRLRKRIREAVGDFELLFENLPSEDKRQVFHFPPTGKTEEKAEKIERFSNGIPCILAFLYESTEDTVGRNFEGYLQNAMQRVADHNGWYLEEFEFNVKFDKNPDTAEWLEKFQTGEATIPEATELLKQNKISSAEFANYVEENLR